MQAAFPVSAIFSGRSPLGSRAQSARPRFARQLPFAAVPALFSVAAAFALANASAGLSAAPVPAHHTAATASARPSGIATARLQSVTRPAVKRSPAVPATYTVKPGDTLSVIAERLYSSPRYWPVLYWANHSQISYANVIQVGQVLTVPVKSATIPAPPSVLGPDPAPAPAPATKAVSAEREAPAPAEPAKSAPAAGTADEARPVMQSASKQASTVSTRGDSSFQACVIARESGGNSQVTNASGHYGLYQFSASTWAEYGGSGSDFGHASVAEQNQVFDNAMAAGGQFNWSPYDGC
jgi:nucleoid-associated protein YgaU